MTNISASHISSRTLSACPIMLNCVATLKPVKSTPMAPSGLEAEDDDFDIDTELEHSSLLVSKADSYGGCYEILLSPREVDVGFDTPASSASEETYHHQRHLDDEQDHLQMQGLTMADFEVRGMLGRGTFGHVYLVRRHREANDTYPKVYALKVLNKAEIAQQRQVEHIKAERYILSRVRHPFVVDLRSTFQDDMNIYMLMSYIPGGELFTYLRRAGRFRQDVARFYLSNIVLALRYLHSYDIVYRDLKPENLLVDSSGYLCLTDFGFAKVVDDRTWTLCGTPEYLAPEIIQNDGHGKAVDWWACGVLCYEMLVGYPPFYAEDPYGIYERILAGQIYWPGDMDLQSRSIIRGFLCKDLSSRLGNMSGNSQDVLDHPWFRGVDWDAVERKQIPAPIVPAVSNPEDTQNFAPIAFGREPTNYYSDMSGASRDAIDSFFSDF